MSNNNIVRFYSCVDICRSLNDNDLRARDSLDCSGADCGGWVSEACVVVFVSIGDGPVVSVCVSVRVCVCGVRCGECTSVRV